jgi:hypothetical protein
MLRPEVAMRPLTSTSLCALLGCSEYEIHPKVEDPVAPDTAAPQETAEPQETGLPPDTSPPEDSAPAVDTSVSEGGCECPEGYAALPADDGCFRRNEVEPTFLGASYAVCPVIPHRDYGKYGARYPGGTVITDDYWGEDDGLPDGRLNATGVWACAADGVSSGYEPVDEWIGFSVCVNVEVPGEYLLGLGADNRMRFSVDGVELLYNTDDNTENFKYWWMFPISLSSGPHIIEFEGYNAGGPAGMGAEISGPFLAGSLSDDAGMVAQDYAGSLVWSASDSLGSTFALGESSGWSCPDGMALDLCAEEPLCYSEEQTDCL